MNTRTLRLNQETLVATLRAQEDARKHQEESLRLEREGHVTDRYSKAVEQLGSVDSLEVRLGGIYALERIAVDDADPATGHRDHRTVVEVLSAFVREHTRQRVPAEDGGAGCGPVATDVQAAVTVLGRLPVRPDVPRAFLARAHLEGTNLPNAHLEGANLSNAHLEGAFLLGAHLRGATLLDAHLEGANLRLAHLEGAFLVIAHLEGAQLVRAHLQGANLSGTYLERADLSGAQVEGAAMLSAHLEGVILTGAAGLTQDQVDTATGDRRTLLPQPLHPPASWV